MAHPRRRQNLHPQPHRLTTVIKPGKTFEPLGKNQLSGKIFATPAAVDGSLILRTDEALYRIGGTVKP